MKQKVIALTGKMAAGKNYICSKLEQYGWLSIDADKLVHVAIENCHDRIIETFGEKAAENNICLLDENGKIQRRELAKILFSSKEELAKQEAIIHPEVTKMMRKFISQNSDKNIILNATVLYKTDILNNVDAIIFVDAPFFTRLKRAKKRDGLKTRLILDRFYSQKHLFAKYKKSDADIYRVRNYGSEKKINAQLAKILESINS